MKRTLSLLLTVMMLCLMLSAPALAEAQEIDTDTVETFTVFYNGTDFNWDNPIAEEITRLTGVALKPHIIIDDPTQAISLMTASGMYDDIILNVDRSTEMMLAVDGYVKLDELIDQYGPNIKAFYGDMYDRLRYSVDNPYIYGFGSGASTVAEQTPGYYWNVGFFLQNSALEALGYPEINTPEDFEKAISDYLAENPTMEDGLPRYGLSLVTADGWRFQFSLTQPAQFTSGTPNDGDWYFNEETGAIEYIMQQDFIKDYFRWMNGMYNKGLIDPESFTQNYDTYLSKIAQGRCVGVIDGYWQFSTAANQLREEQPENTYMAFAPLTDPDNMTWMADQPGNVTSAGGFSITTACANPAKVVSFFDFLASEEGQILTEWGIEGANYTVDENGDRIRNADDVAWDMRDGVEFLSATGVKLYARGYGQWLHQPAGWHTSDGKLLTSENAGDVVSGFSEAERKSLSEYGKTYFTDVFPNPSTLPIRAYGDASSLPVGTNDDTKIAQQKVQDMRLTYLAKAIMCEAAEYDAIWDEYMQELEDANLAILIEEINQSLEGRLTLWNVK